MGIALSTRAIGKNAHEPTWPFKELPSIPAADLNSKSLELCHHRDRFGATIPKFRRMPDAYLGYYNERRPREKLGWLSPMQHHRSLGPATRHRGSLGLHVSSGIRATTHLRILKRKPSLSSPLHEEAYYSIQETLTSPPGWLHNRSEEMPAYPYHNYLAQTLPIPYANLADPFPVPYQSLPHSLHCKILVLPGEIL